MEEDISKALEKGFIQPGTMPPPASFSWERRAGFSVRALINGV